MHFNLKILAIIPARGESKGIPRKNIKMMCGKPLIAYSISAAQNSMYDLDVIVSTEDEEIARISTLYGAAIVPRPQELSTDEITLDPVIDQALKAAEEKRNCKYDIVITMQPTSPLLKTATLDRAIEYFLTNNFDSVISAVNRPHLAWTKSGKQMIPVYTKRVNRQSLPCNFVETGAFFISKRCFIREDSRLGKNVSVFEIPENESIDIDLPQDWWVAEKFLSRKNILIRVEGYAEIGLGHIYRALLLTDNLVDHTVRIVLSKKSDLGIEKVKKSQYPFIVINNENELKEIATKYNTDILINDILNTSKEYTLFCKSFVKRVINIEDMGEGMLYADAVINDLYEKKTEYKNHYWGSDYYCIRNEFLLAAPSKVRDKVEEILVIFGGTDPCDFSRRLLFIAEEITNRLKIHFTFILGLGYRDAEELIRKNKNKNITIVKDVQYMPGYMAQADLAVSSQGRTMLELASMAVPTILIAQNKREQDHEFGYIRNGFINLGLGIEIKDQTIMETLHWLINSPQIRLQMKEQMLKKDLRKGLSRVLDIILNT